MIVQFLIAALCMPLIIISLIFSKFLFYRFFWHHSSQRVLPFLILGTLFLTHEFFLLAVTYYVLGIPAYVYSLGIVAFYMVNQTYGTIVILSTPYVALLFDRFEHVTQLGPTVVLGYVVFSLAVLGLAKQLKRWLGRHNHWGLLVLLLTVTLVGPLTLTTVGLNVQFEWWLPLALIIGCVLIFILTTSVKQQVTHYELEMDRIRWSEQHDALTGLYNYGRFKRDLVNLELRLQHKELTEVLLLMVDIDHFKAFNDHYGHLLGNQTLTKFATVLRTFLVIHSAKEFWSYRFGGEEFCLVFEDTTLPEVVQAVQNLQAFLKANPLDASADQTIKITFSAGIASTLSYQQNLEQTLKAADQALYQAKDAGRSCVKVDCRYLDIDD